MTQANVVRTAKFWITVFAAAFAARAFASCPDFGLTSYPAGSHPGQAAAADFNGDGLMDVAVVGSSGTLLVLLANDDGTFTTTTVATGTGGIFVSTLAVADLNHDGKPDIVTNIGVFLGNGDGTFRRGTNAFSSARFIKLFDVDHDGNLDIVWADGSKVWVEFGDGNGSFFNLLVVEDSPAVSGEWSVDVADLNGDGRADFVIGTQNSSIWVVFRNSDGTFSAPVEYATPSGPFYVALADFNHDGKVDIATANISGSVSIFLGNGSGGFSGPVTYGTGSQSDFIDVRDFNHDGNLDIVVPNFGSNSVSLLLGDGSGGFAAALNFGVGAGPNSAAFADMNGDDQLDIVTANDSGSISILTDICRTTCGSYFNPTNFTAGTTPKAIATADVNGDGKADLVTANFGANSFSLLTGNGSGSFSAPANTAIANGSGPVAVTIADFNNDGKPDVAVANETSGNVSIFIGGGNGNFTAGNGYVVGSSPSSIVSGDFNRDGKMDLAIANRNSNNISILIGNGDGTFAAAVNYAAGSGPASIAAGGFNGDGYVDLAVANQGSNNISVFLNNGNGTFATAVPYAAGTGPDFIAVSDFNGDNKRDLAVANLTSGNVSIFTGNGDGTFGSASNFAVGTNPTAIAIADFDGDGKRDLAVANKGSNNVSLLLGVGDGTFGSAPNIAMGTAAAAIVAVDANGHGKFDLATANTTTNNVSVAINFCPVSDLAVTKSHSGSFRQGDSGQTFTIVVSNVPGTGIVSSAGTVTVNDPIPSGLTATAVAGTGWSCTTTPVSCQRNDPLAPGSSFPAITVTVNVSADAQSGTNTATVSGGGNVNSSNDTASDAYTVVPVSDLTVTQTHPTGMFRGQTGATYLVMVGNAGQGPTVGTVNVVDTVPAGLTATAVSGSGWTCNTPPAVVCQRSSVLTAGGFYPPITVTVSVGSNAPLSVTNTVTVSGGGELNTVNDTSSDVANVALAQQAVCPNFGAAASFGTTLNPTSVAVADFNRNGTLDLVIANSGTNNVTFVAGNANGTFSVVSNFGAGTDPRSIVAGDFNRDSRMDYATANFASNDVTVFSGNGNGTFTSAATVSVGTAPLFVVAADLNRDGKLDLVVANSGSNNVSVLIGKGDGTFNAAVNYAVGSSPASIAIGDFNRDGKPDLIVANRGSNNVSLLTNKGDGTFNAAVNTNVGSNPVSVAVADFNRDGKLDVAVVNSGGSNNISLLTGNGAAGFASNTTIAFTGGLYVAAGDVNGDGAPDLLLVATGSNNLSVLVNDGSGGFAPAVTFGAGTAPVSIATGDFDRDGKLDVVVVNNTAGGASVLLNSSTCSLNCGTFSAPVNFAASTNPQSIAIADFDLDGRPDLAVANSGAGNISVLIANGDGTFAAPVNYATAAAGTSTTPWAIAAGDFNGDGKPDLAVANKDSTTSIAILLNNGNGTFAAPTTYLALINPYAIAVGDFNNDGKLDLAVAEQATDNMRVFLGAGDGTFPSSTAFSCGTGSSPQSIAVGDFNRDGNIDIVTADYGTNNISVFFGNGSGGFGPATNITAVPFPADVVTGDFNRDGILDLAIANQDRMWVMTGTAAGGFNVATASGSLRPYSNAAPGDFNVDGITDLVASGGNLSEVAILRGNGAGALGPDTYYEGGPSSYVGPVAVGDFNRDGKPDIAAGNYLTANVAILTNGCPAPDVTITNVHNGTFTRGQSGTYTLRVTNAGGSPTTSTVVISDAVPAGLTASSLSGTGWSCDLPSVTCSRADALAAGASYPDLTLSVSIGYSVSVSVTNAAIVAGGGELNSANNSSGDIAPVALLASTTSVSSTPNPAVFGQSVSFTATVTGSGPTPTGSVRFFDDATLLQLVALDGTAHATCNLSSLSVGAHNITAAYSGDATFGTSTSPIVIQTINQSVTLTVVASSKNPALTGQSVPLTATVTVTAPGSGTPTGTVTFKDGATTLGSSPLTNAGQASFNANTIGGGARSITAVYSGDTNFLGSTSAALIQQMNFTAPANVVATTRPNGTQIDVTWDIVPQAPGYKVFRSSQHGAFVYVGSTPTASFTDTPPDADTTYLYKALAVDGGTEGPLSDAFDFATTTAFTNDPIVAGETVAAAAHITQLRTIIIAMEDAAGAPHSTFTNPIATGSPIRASDIVELRGAVNAARAALGFPPITFGADPAAGDAIPAQHVQELREPLR